MERGRRLEREETATGRTRGSGGSHEVERWRLQEKRKEEVEEEEEEEKEEGEVQKKEIVEEVRRAHHQFVYDKNEERQKEGGKQKSERRSKARQALEKFGKWLFFLIMGQNWLCIGAAAEGPRRRTGGSDEDATGVRLGVLRKYMRRYKEGPISFSEKSTDPGRRKWRSSSREKPRRDGDLQQMWRGSQMRMRALAIVSIRQGEFLWQQLGSD